MPILRILGRLTGYEKSLSDAAATIKDLRVERQSLLADVHRARISWSAAANACKQHTLRITRLCDQIIKMGGKPCE